MFTRLTATVIISAPDASWALIITAGELYLPVPTMRRDEKILSAITKVSIVLRRTIEVRQPFQRTAIEIRDLTSVASRRRRNSRFRYDRRLSRPSRETPFA